MSIFDPAKLTTKYLAPATSFRPIDGRKYTLTHSDTTGQLFLTIGCEYDAASVNPQIRDEVKAEWISRMGEFTLFGWVHVSEGEFDKKLANVRYLIFKKELSLALQAIVYGDQNIFINFPWLLDAPIYIQFQSDFPQYNQILYHGTPRQYLLSTKRETKP